MPNMIAAELTDVSLPTTEDPEEQFLVKDEMPPPISSCKSNTGLSTLSLLRVQEYRRAVALLLVGCLAVAAVFGSAKLASASSSEVRTKHPMSATPQQKHEISPCVTQGGMPACPAIGLFEKGEVLDLATDNIFRVGRGLVSLADRGSVRGIVAQTFKDVSIRLQQASPRLAEELEMIQLDDQQKAAVLTSLRLMSHRDVQRIGINVARAVRSDLDSKDNRTMMQKDLERKLHPLLGEMLSLRRQLVPKVMQQFWAASRQQWDMTLDLENMRIMQRDSSDMTEFPPLATSDIASMQIGIEDGALEQARALIDLIKFSAHLSGRDVSVPAKVTSLLARTEKHGPLSCELSNVELNKADLMKAFFCPLKFGSQGIDALRASAKMPLLERTNVF